MIANAGGSIAGKVSSVKNTGEGVAAMLEDNTEIQADAIVVGTTSTARNCLAEKLGCKTNDTGLIFADNEGRTSVEGIYAAGDEVADDETLDLQQINVAAASGHKAAIGINTDLSKAERNAEGAI